MKQVENTGHIKGQVTVELYDKSGTLKKRIENHNTITAPLMRGLFSNGMKKGALTGTLMTAQTDVWELNPTSCGIYLMNTPVGIEADTELAPYLDATRLNVNNDVVGYNLGGSAAVESTPTMTAQSGLSKYYDIEDKYTVIYDKTLGKIDIASIIIGTDHTLAKTVAKAFVVAQRAEKATKEISTGVAQHILEHTASGTIIYCSPSATGKYYKVNLGTGAMSLEQSNSNIHTNMTGQFTGLLVGSTVYKVARQSVTSSQNGAYIARVTMVKNWTGAITVSTFDITFHPRKDYTTSNAFYPVLIHNYAKNKLEVFLTLTAGEFEDGKGFNLWKQNLNIAADGSLSLSGDTQDLGIFPFSVSTDINVTLGFYRNGAHHYGKYYWPIHSIYNAVTGVETPLTAGAGNPPGLYYCESVCIDEDFQEEPRYLISGQPTLAALEYVNIGDGKVLPMAASTAACPIVHISQVVSGIDLPEIVHKDLEDIVRISYTYKFNAKKEGEGEHED
jgi:hypothetical protein